MNSRLNKNKNIRKKIKSEEKTRKRVKAKKRIQKMLIIIFVILLLLLIYARYIETSLLLVHEEKIDSLTIEGNFNGLKIVHFSDLHFGSTIHEKQLKRIVNRINELKPDIVVFTGDLFEEDYVINDKEEKNMIRYLKMIESKYGKYAVNGNHDIDSEKFNNIIYDSGFIFLNNDYDVIYNYDNETVGIFGVDNITLGTPDLTKYNEKEYNDAKYKILLVHEPDYMGKIKDTYNFDLVLAGHSHNQQIRIPGIKGFWLPDEGKIYYESHYKINNTELYVSNGIGTSLLKLRFFSPPSINLYRINKSKGN